MLSHSLAFSFVRSFFLGCDNALRSRPVFDTTDPLLAACEQELCDIFEGITTPLPPPRLTPTHTLHIRPKNLFYSRILAFLPLIFYHCIILSCLLYLSRSFLGLRRYSSLNILYYPLIRTPPFLLPCMLSCTLYLSRSFLGFRR